MDETRDNPSDEDAARADPARADPASADPARADPAESEPTESEPEAPAPEDAGDPELGDDRIAALQRELQRTRGSFFIVVALLFLLQFADLTAQLLKSRSPRFDTVATQRLLILDGDDEARANLSVGDTGSTALTFFDEAGKGRATMMVDKEGHPSVAFTGPDATLQGLLTVDEKGPRLSFYDARGVQRAGLASSSDANLEGQFPGLYLYDEAGRSRARLFVAGHEGRSYSVLGLSDGKGQSRASLIVDDEGRPILRFLDPAGEPYLSLHVEESQGRPFMYVTNKRGEIVWEAN